MNEVLLHRISQIIIENTKIPDVIEYNQISKKIGDAISPRNMNEPLGEISYRCIQRGLPPLSAIVVNQETRLPGDGFFTWVAAQMGFPNLPPSQWEGFYKKQKENVFNYKDWDSFLDTSFTIQSKKSSTSNGISIGEILKAKKYLKGKNTPYYILTVKTFLETQKKGPFRYHVLILEKGTDTPIKQAIVEDDVKTQLLTTAKRKGVQLLLEYNSQIRSDMVTIVHYKHDRPGNDMWEKEPLPNQNATFIEERSEFFQRLVEKDVEMEEAQEDSFYKDGKVTEYYGIRYERNPLNRAKAIQFHGCTCKACGFNFEKYYGEYGKDYIEIHHIKPLSSVGNEVEIDPRTDLVPVCSNCHRMIHRNKNHVLSIEELKDLIKKQKLRNLK